jgi:hypothetical protein
MRRDSRPGGSRFCSTTDGRSPSRPASAGARPAGAVSPYQRSQSMSGDR